MRWGPQRSGYYDIVRGTRFVDEQAFDLAANDANESGVDDFNEGEFAEIAADGITAKKNGATAAEAAYPVAVGYERSDVQAGKSTTLAIGSGYWLETSAYDTVNPDNYPVDTELSVKNGILEPAASGEMILAVVKRAPALQQTYAQKALQRSSFTTLLVQVENRGRKA